MTHVTVNRTPATGGTPVQWQAFTLVGTSIGAALSDANDGTYLESGASLATVRQQLAYAIFSPLNLPSGAVIEYIQPVVRERHGQGGHITVAELHARDSYGVHKTAWSLAPIGANPADNTWRTTNGPIYFKAADGTEWTDCQQDSFTAVIAWGPRWWDVYFSTIDVKPALSRIELIVAYRTDPPCTIGGTGTAPVSDPRPPVTWESGQVQEAYRVVVVAVGTVDGSGRSAGSATFDPATVAAPAYDSGKVYSALTETVVTRHLTPGFSYYNYVRVWGPSIGTRELFSPWAVSGPYAVSQVVAKAPTIVITEDTSTYSLNVAVTRVVPGGAEVAPAYYSLQSYDQDTSTWVDVQGAQRFSGPGPWSYFDSTRSASDTVKYRVRGVYITAGAIEVGSTWVEATIVVTNRGEWWIRDPSNAFLNIPVDLVDYSETIPKPQEVAYGAGAHAATVTHQGVRAGQHKVKIRTLTKVSYDALRSLLDSGRSLVLVSVFGDAWRVQLADNAEVTIVRAAPTASDTTPVRAFRMLILNFIEVER